MQNLFMPLRPLMADKLLYDDREPFATFTIPGTDGSFQVLAPKIQLWLQLLTVVLVCTVVQCCFASAIYYGIVKRRGSMESYILGWGLIVPVSIPWTFWVIDGMAISNKVLKLGAGNITMTVFFRCIEAMYGCSMEVTEKSLLNYIAYYSTAAPYVWTDKSRATPTSAEIGVQAKRCAVHFLALSAVLSFMMHFNFQPFHSNVVLNQFHINSDVLAPGHIANAYCQTVMTYLTLFNLFEINSFGENLKGVSTEQIFRNPMFESRTPTEFWTVRWNRMVHKILKGGIFLPTKKFFGPTVAVLLTFIFSGLLHDYIWLGVFYHSEYIAEQEAQHSILPFVPIFGKLTAFFFYTGVIMILQRPFGNLPGVRYLSENLPIFVVSTFLVILHLPFAHWYIGDWVEGGMFRDLSLGLFTIRKVA